MVLTTETNFAFLIDESAQNRLSMSSGKGPFELWAFALSVTGYGSSLLDFQSSSAVPQKSKVVVQKRCIRHKSAMQLCHRENVRNVVRCTEICATTSRRRKQPPTILANAWIIKYSIVMSRFLFNAESFIVFLDSTRQDVTNAFITHENGTFD